MAADPENMLAGDAAAAQASGSPQQPDSMRGAAFVILEADHGGNRRSRIVDVFLIALITISVLAVVLESVPELELEYESVFYWLEVFTVIVFSIEYLLRIWTCVEAKRGPMSAWDATTKRIRFMLTPYAIIDLLAILPFYLVLLGAIGNVDMRFLRALRLLRILKLTRYSSAFDMLITSVRENVKSLMAAFFVLITVMLLAASGMYFFERDAQPGAFRSIPAAMWWAFSTLTTVGYGDVTPITAAGKVFGAVITVFGIGMVALPTGILASGYAHQIRIRSRRFRSKADEAWDDGVLTDEEKSDLEDLRVELGLSSNTASQILDDGRVQRALREQQEFLRCPRCGARI